MKNIDLEFYDKDFPNGDRRLNIERETSYERNLKLTMRREDGVCISMRLEEKEALELASQLFRGILGLY